MSFTNPTEEGGVANAITSSAVIADNTVVRGDGGARGIQDSGISIDDSDNVTGVVGLTMSAALTMGNQWTITSSDVAGTDFIDFANNSVNLVSMSDGTGGTPLIAFASNVDAPATLVTANGTQTTNLSEWKDNSSTLMTSISGIGTVTAPIFDTGVAAAGVTLTATTLAADGTDAAIDITITPKGNAGIVLPDAAGAPGTTTNKLYQTGGVLYFDGVSLEGAGGASAALDNLASVAINTTLVSDTDNTDALGTAAIGWSDLFLGNGSVVTWSTAPSTADVTLTHSANALTFAGGTIVLGTATAAGGLTGDVTGNADTATAAASQVITDNAIVTVDDADAADNDYARFTANGVEGREYSEVLGDLSGEATGAFSFNSQALTSVGAIGCGTVTSTGNLVIADAGTIGSASDTDAIAISAGGVVALSQNVTIAAAKNLYFDGGGNTYMTSPSSDVFDIYVGGVKAISITESTTAPTTFSDTIIVPGDVGLTGTRVTKGWFTDLEVTNDITIGGTALASTYSPIAGSGSIVTTGALDSGSITSNFGTIDNGASSITTTGDITGGGIHVTGDTAAGDNAALGYTATEGMVITGQGSATDVTIKNDADATVLSIPTGTSTVALGVDGTVSSLVLTEKASIALDPVGGADGDYSGITIAGTAGATLAFGDLVYFDPTDSRWELADANAAAAADGDARGILGLVVLAAGSDGDPVTVLLQGVIRADTAFPALTINAPAYVSETAGDIVVTAPSTASNVVRVVGQAFTANELYFNPSSDWIIHT
ncbi:MAG: hypothetical protein GY861_18390 [bacterium]|nr:hypothetical protein [bacterium]